MLFRIALMAHLLATFVWLGHMFFWSLFAGPVLKKVEPPAAAERLRGVSMRMGGLGWPALAVLLVTGAYLLSVRGIAARDLLRASFWSDPSSHVLGLKLLLVALMVGYQLVVGHRRAPRAIYLDMAAALLVLGASVMIARGG